MGENVDGIDALDYGGEKFVKDKVGETLLLVAVDALPREKKVRLTLNLEKVSVNEKTEEYLNPLKKEGRTVCEFKGSCRLSPQVFAPI